MKNCDSFCDESIVKQYLTEIDATKLLSYEEELELSRRVQAGDKTALDHLIKANLRLVVKIAKKYVSNEYSLIDLIQDGNLGLMKAAERYDYHKKVRFSTYSSWWIKQSIVRSIIAKKRMIKIPYRKEEALRLIKKCWNELNQSLKRVPSVSEIADELDMSVDFVEKMLLINNKIILFDDSRNLDDGDNGDLLDVIEDETYNPINVLIDENLKNDTTAAVSELKEREIRVLQNRYGLEDGCKVTLKNMGTKLGLSAETVRKIEEKALSSMRERFGYLRDYIVG